MCQLIACPSACAQKEDPDCCSLPQAPAKSGADNNGQSHLTICHTLSSAVAHCGAVLCCKTRPAAVKLVPGRGLLPGPHGGIHERPTEQLLVLFGSALPAEVLRHARLLQGCPRRLVVPAPRRRMFFPSNSCLPTHCSLQSYISASAEDRCSGGCWLQQSEHCGRNFNIANEKSSLADPNSTGIWIFCSRSGLR